MQTLALTHLYAIGSLSKWNVSHRHSPNTDFANCSNGCLTLSLRAEGDSIHDNKLLGLIGSNRDTKELCANREKQLSMKSYNLRVQGTAMVADSQAHQLHHHYDLGHIRGTSFH